MTPDKRYLLLPPSYNSSLSWELFDADRAESRLKFVLSAESRSEALLKCAVVGIAEDEIEEIFI